MPNGPRACPFVDFGDVIAFASMQLLSRARCLGASSQRHRNMADIADRQISVRTTCSTDGASKYSETASVRESVGHRQNRSACAGLCTLNWHLNSLDRLAGASQVCSPAMCRSTTACAARRISARALASPSVVPLVHPDEVLVITNVAFGKAARVSSANTSSPDSSATDAPYS
jgi:hypothetical protein